MPSGKPERLTRAVDAKTAHDVGNAIANFALSFV